MLNYKLYKQLKEVGFPQVPENHIAVMGENERVIWEGSIPTLEELIEAVGKETFTLWSYNKRWFCGLRRIMRKVYGCLTDTHTLIIDYEDYVFGKTPLEAVAKLYIKLNEKNKL